jgi:hemoglobin-like flavoprotein
VANPTADVFLASLNRCLAEPGFIAGFYDRFFRSSREVREKFRHTDMERQIRVLADTLFVVANAVQGEDGSVVRSGLPSLAKRHSRGGLDIGPHLYALWTDCLVATAKATDPQFDGTVEAAWREVLAFGVRYMTDRY